VTLYQVAMHNHTYVYAYTVPFILDDPLPGTNDQRAVLVQHVQVMFQVLMTLYQVPMTSVQCSTYR
jgi:hypothetical protein